MNKAFHTALSLAKHTVDLLIHWICAALVVAAAADALLLGKKILSHSYAKVGWKCRTAGYSLQ